MAIALWLWVGVSRLTRRVLGTALGDRADETLARAWAQVPEDYRGQPVYTDRWGAYGRLLPAAQHHPCDKSFGQGVGPDEHRGGPQHQASDTKWRQRQSGLVRRSCGVHPGIATDVSERFVLLVDERNGQSARRWQRRQQEGATTQSNP